MDFSPMIALIAYRCLRGFALEDLRQLINMMGV
ncbi:hypothetical protein QUF84_18030 [Fictibacillus enclensis]|nr:hypothetical protein [Fictibacillus enclensis]MDM5339105.1 hypothetical protein [Fictibacillus enclensis]